MAGETTNRIGNLGENFINDFLKYFKWQKQADLNVDFNCSTEGHKTHKDKEKKTHGIDGVYSYESTFELNLKEVLIVECKNISWGTKSAKDATVPKNDPEIEKDINKYLKTLQEKVICSQTSSSFKEIFDLKTTSYKPTGVLFYYIRDGLFDKEKFYKIIPNLSLPPEIIDSSIFIISNDKIEDLATMFNHLKIKSHDGTKLIEFMTPQLNRKTYTSPWNEYLSLTNVFSNFIVARINNSENVYNHYIFYFGEYNQESLKRLISCLAHYNLLAFPNLKFCPINITDPVKESIPFRRYFKDGKLTFDDIDISASIDVENLTRAIPQFSLCETE